MQEPAFGFFVAGSSHDLANGIYGKLDIRRAQRLLPQKDEVR